MIDIVNQNNLDMIKRALAVGAPEGMFYPSVYIVEVGSECNLECIMCPNRRMSSEDKGFIDVDLFERIIIDIAPYCEFLMLYWMGEPLLHPRLPELLKIASSHIKGKIVLSSNMTYLNDDIAESILSNIDILLCCIDRWDKRAYERIRRGGIFEETVSNTEDLLRRRGVGERCEIVVKAMDIDQRSGEYDRFYSYWSSRGAHPLMAWLNDWAGTFSQIRKKAAIPFPYEGEVRVPCADLWFKAAINWRGDIQMCCFDWTYSFPVGRYEKSVDWLHSAWQSNKIVDLRKAHIEGRWGDNVMCKKCKTWGEESELDAYVMFGEDSYFSVF